jgi:hypothetical protein
MIVYHFFVNKEDYFLQYCRNNDHAIERAKGYGDIYRIERVDGSLVWHSAEEKLKQLASTGDLNNIKI